MKSSVVDDIHNESRESVRKEARMAISFVTYDWILEELFLPMRQSVAGGVLVPVQNWFRGESRQWH